MVQIKKKIFKELEMVRTHFLEMVSIIFSKRFKELEFWRIDAAPTQRKKLEEIWFTELFGIPVCSLNKLTHWAVLMF